MRSLKARRVLTLFLSVSVLAGFVVVPPPAVAAPAHATPQQDRIVPTRTIKTPERPVPAADAASQVAMRKPEPVAWPSGEVTIDPAAPGQKQVSALPVRLVPATTAATGPVTVAALDRAAADRADVPGLVLSLRAPQSKAQAPVSVTVDYSGFAHAFGGDYANRLRFHALPACAMTTPERPQCRAVPLPTRGDTGKRTVTTETTLSGQPTYLAVAPAAAGDSADFGATSLAPSASWTSGGSTGDFEWSYPFRVPPSTGGTAPALGLTYSSGSVDGRVASTNNQPSWIGEGFGLESGYVERKYRSCADDMSGGNNTVKTYDLCWGGDNATVVLHGKALELVHDANHPDVWKPVVDDGSRIQRVNDAANGDKYNEKWILTTTDGTRYIFGEHQLPGWSTGKPVTNSVYTVPVFGNQPGEPCHAATFAASWCQRAYRWNLDYVVDPDGNAQAYYYAKEMNSYGRNQVATDDTPYVRGGYLTKVDYGFRDGGAYDKPPQQVTFDVGERCVPSGAITCDPSQLTKANASYWPDVPFDRICDAGTSCTNRFSPAFFTRKRLATVTTKVWNGSGYRNVESWTLAHTFPSPGDTTSRALWLSSIVHTGLVGGVTVLPAIRFEGVQMANRVDGLEGYSPINRYRISAILNETGGTTSITYSAKDCARGSRMPATLDGNTMRCFPAYWQPPDRADELLDWFHKYVVTQVTDADGVGLAPTMVTTYRYGADAAWHWTDDEITPWKRRTWGEYHGYETVTVQKGETNQPRSSVLTRYFRGMSGDRKQDGSYRSVSITDTDGGTFADLFPFRGMMREVVNYASPGGPIASGIVTDPWITGPTAVENKDGRGGVNAYMVAEAVTRGRTALSAGGWRRVQATKSYNGHGLVTQVDNRGDVADPNDDQCTRTTYAENTAKWLLAFASRVETVAKNCDTAPSRPDDIVADTRTSYDGQANGAAPTAGNATNVEDISGWDSGQATYLTAKTTTYDAYGRVTSETDAKSNKTTTAFTPPTGGPVTGSTTTNPLGWTATRTVDPAWGLVTAQTDANGRRTDLGYDPLGRRTSTWLPDNPKQDNPNRPSQEYTYLLRTNGPSAVGSKVLQNNGTYLLSYQLYDGFLRPRQTQAPAHGGGRLITDTFYDSRGLATKANGKYTDGKPVSTDLAAADDNEIPIQTLTEFDGLERATATITAVRGQEKWRTTTTYDGDHRTVTPPAGGIAKTVYFDSRGRATELRQHNGSGYDSTRYTYDGRGQQTSVTDAAGNTWRYHYDIRGRQTQVDDPDKGTAAMTYDELNRLISSTDARGQTLSYRYDALGRKTELHSGDLTGPLRASWAYDTLAKGLPTSSTRYDNGNAYVVATAGYDARNRPLGSILTLPASEGKLAGTYTTKVAYTLAGQLQSTTYPATNDLPAETVWYDYNDVGQPNKASSGMNTYVTDALYSPYGETLQVNLAANGKWLDLSYSYEEGTRRLSGTRTTSSSAPADPVLSDTSYTYNPAGNVTKIADSAAKDTQCFSYDAYQQLTEAWTPGSGDCGAAPDALSGPAPYWQSFRYDKAGNRTSKTDHAANVVTAYAYPPPGEPHPHAVQTSSSGGVTMSYGYDAAGNTTAGPYGPARAPANLAYDAEGHLASVGAQTNLYDAEGNLLLTRVPGKVTVQFGATELALDANANAVKTTRFYQFASKIVGARSADGLVWISSDHHDTGLLAVNASSGQVARRFYTPFGEDRGAAAQWPVDRGFVGGVTGSGTALTHLGARDYDSAGGRFITVDPVFDATDPQNLNGYSYADDNPVTRADPAGQMPPPDAEERIGWRAAQAARQNWDNALQTAKKWWNNQSWRRGGRNVAAAEVQALGTAAVLIAAKLVIDPHYGPGALANLHAHFNVVGGDGRVGMADIVFIDTHDKIVFVWAVKSQYTASLVKPEFDHFRAAVQTSGKWDGWSVAPGFKLGVSVTLPLAGDPSKNLTVQDTDVPGFVIHITSDAPPPPPVPVPVPVHDPVPVPNPGAKPVPYSPPLTDPVPSPLAPALKWWDGLNPVQQAGIVVLTAVAAILLLPVVLPVAAAPAAVATG
ncbi:RHS repeat-associated core domain-containing protein [Amycolatopsis sp. WGS_07]|uniref:RHS repeat domain-containing protein n=1 Tax=Amycolatopsis sp. WGS_07 TaxID=3076764 RepID=UPI0038736075